jgi:hypothetical protein
MFRAMKVMHTVKAQAKPSWPAVRVVEEALACGVSRKAAYWAYWGITGSWPPAKCVACDRTFKLRNMTFNRVCPGCAKVGPHRIVSGPEVIKRNARALANVALRRGKIQRQPCRDCGATKAEKHHPDYSKPLDIIWLCRDCHMTEHRNVARET